MIQNRKKKILKGLLAFLCFQTLVQAQEFYSQLESELQTKLNSIVRENNLPGVTFSLLLNEEHQITLAAGFSDTEEKIPMRPDSKMPAGSVGKIFFAAVALKMIQEGKLNLDDKASSYLGDTDWYSTFPNHDDIKIINLMNHTSGLPRHLFQPEFMEDFVKDPKKKRAPVDCIQSIANKEPVHPVGKGWAYSDTNYILLGLIVEKITGRDFYDLIQEQILDPLWLDLTVPQRSDQIEGLAQGYVGPNNPFGLPKKVVDTDGNFVLDPSFEWAGGGFVSNPKDLTKMVKFIQEGEYLDEDTKTKLRKAVSMSTGQAFDNGYGLGTFVWSKRNDTRYGHSGFFPGYVSHVEYSQNRQYALAIQVNDDGTYAYLQQFLFDLEEIVDNYLGSIDDYTIRQNFKKQEDCWNNSNIECYMEAYAKTEPIQTASQGGITYGYDNIIGNYKKYFPKERMGELYFDNINTRRLSDHLYFVTGRFNLKFPGREELAQGWFSVNMKKIKGKWYMITDHSS
ncbi:beta-lactamase family protein [Muricauda sp. CAU 1633]|uniref:serine hydrolase domain-containing protein n=1 Tax=Allomuricauda sp. CAU 1633 TaxID=2816036 RepID=UPI001A8FDA4D|nr:serine hydrolase domain-containing protein [Muricauda sp. CAU 1633]MBO0323006.1 beta-lactamase family protein [Muricauda sp. CAU 1633]